MAQLCFHLLVIFVLIIALAEARHRLPEVFARSLSLGGGGSTDPNNSNLCSVQMCQRVISHQRSQRSHIELSARQRLQVIRREDFILRYSNPEVFWTNSTEVSHSEPVVEITQEQEVEILESYPNLFRSYDELPPVPSRGLIHGSGRQHGSVGKRAQQVVCPQETRWEDVMFALDSDGLLCQVIQLSNNRQWVMSGKCEREASIVVPNVLCVEEVSYVGVMVVDFATAQTQMKDIEITHCVAKLVT